MSKLASFVAGFGGGYLRARDKEYDRERQAKMDARQDKLDAQQAEQFGWARDAAAAAQRERDNRDALDKAVTEGMDAGKVKDAAAVSYTGADGAQKTAYQPDLQTAQFAADQQRLEEGQSLTPPAAPSAPKAEQAASVRTLDGARRLFSGLTAASDAKKFADDNPVTPYAKYMALSERLAGMAGGQEKADAYLKRAKDAEKEGAFRALTMLDAGDPDGALKAWNSTGAKRLDAGQKFVTATDKAGNRTHQVVNSDGSVAVPNVEQAMLRYLSGIEGVAKQAESRAASQSRMREELFKPRVLKQGETFGALDPVDGKWKEFAQGSIPAGYEAMTDPQGNTILRKIDGGGRGAGTGTAEKPKNPLDEATKAVEFVIDKSAAKGALEPQQVARANTIGRQLVASATAEGRGLDPAVAGEIAINVATGKMAPVNSFNPRTGTVDSVVDYQGSKLAIESFGSPTNSRLPPEQMASVALGFIAKLSPEQQALMVPAGWNSQARAKLNAQLDARLRSPESLAALEQRLGRKPTDADLTQASRAAQAAIQPQIELISRWSTRTPEGEDVIRKIMKEAGYTSDGKSEAPKKAEAPAGAATGASRVQQPGGMMPRPTLAQRQQATQAAKERMATEEAEAARTAMSDAQRLLQAGNVPELARFQASSAFNKLDRATKTAIYNKVNGLQ
jgi:hypothetical protein